MHTVKLLAASAAFSSAIAGATPAGAQPFVGEMIWVGFNFCPAGWAPAQGQLLPISEFETLFQLIGTTYGGDGQSSFALPDLQGRVAVHSGQGAGLSNWTIGEMNGTESNTLSVNQMPPHSHSASTTFAMQASSATGQTAAPEGNVLADGRTSRIFAAAPANVDMDPTSVSTQTTVGVSGGGQPHDNMQPYTVINACISLFGIFPSQN